MELDDLDSKLQTWQTDIDIPPRFQAEVWQQIAAREEARRHSIWSRFREGLFFQLAKPQYATALIVLSVSVSLGLAHLQARGTNARHLRELESRYVNSIDPLAAPSI